MTRYLVFTLLSTRYAVPLLRVKEVLALPEVTPIPFTAAHVKGIMNLRGTIISVVDLRARFRLRGTAPGPEAVVILLDLASVTLGVIVDSVEEVIAATPEAIQPRPALETDANAEHILGILRQGEQLTLVLDIDKTLGGEQRRVA